ncbi:MAG: hypothetical protein AYK19_09980 [Theionarchaea archaeon DG-70-1]|nr:MAG: hypothetical protein AYK19_09980 [Theionarchaea archaeon DG-70-1]
MEGTEFLLLLIGSLEGTIEGEARLQKLTFLATAEYKIQLPFEFARSSYGPYSGEIQYSLKEMESAGLLKEEAEEYISIFTLTEEGKREFNKIKRKFPSENERINNLIERFGRKRIHDILSYIYGRYMKPREEDVIAHDVS